jgi:hypothetical protein
MKKIFTFFLSLNLTHAWIGFFLYSCLVSILVQFFILPILFPRFHIGSGLLDGGDWTFYHSKAVELSKAIKSQGWSNWELKPYGFGILGFITAIYSFFDIYEPYVLIPFFSILHSLGAISIVLLIEKLGVNRATSILSSIPFLIFPSSLMWVTQILKDIFTINGSILILLGLTSLFSLMQKKIFKYNLIKIFWFFLLIFIGLVLIWLVRPYYVVINQIFIVFIFIIINFYLVFNFLKKKFNFLIIIYILFLQIILLISVNQLYGLIKNNLKDINENSFLISIPSPVLKDNLINLDSSPIQSSKNLLASESKNSRPIIFKEWSSSTYLPTIIDNELKKLYSHRIYFYQVQSKANSTFDMYVDLNSFKKLVLYLPRAVQISFFSPFPSSWFAEHPSQLSKLMHLVYGFEMIIIYFCFLGFIFSILLWRRKIEFWIFITFSFYYALIPTYALPNIGTIVRYRYSAIMILVALGIGAFLHLYSKKLYINK